MVTTFFESKPAIHRIQRHEGPDQQRRAHQQNHRQAHLAHHQRGASFDSAAGRFPISRYCL